MQNIKWLFFDLGSTLIDETDCINDRIEQIYSFTKISKNNIRNRMYELSNNSSIPLKIIAKENGVESGELILVTGGKPGLKGDTSYLELDRVK